MRKETILYYFILSLSGLIFVFTWSSCKEVEARIFPLSEPWEEVIPHLQIPKGLKSLSAAECGSCHEGHYKEWQTSTHALAWSDQQFQSEIKKESSPFFCINCHIPLQDQQAYIIKGKIANDIYKPVKIVNPHFDQNLQSEAITCAVCHIRNGAVIATKTNNKAPHKTIVDKSFLSEELCISCHNANAHVSDQLVCSFETGDEWKSGAYYNKRNCIDCHMEYKTRHSVSGDSSFISRLHAFPGSGISKQEGLDAPMLNGIDISIEQNGNKYQINDSLLTIVSLKNIFAGHRVPTGDPERFIILDMTLSNEHQDTLAYNTNRIGEKWQWYPTIKKLSDNNFNVGEIRKYKLPYVFLEKGIYYLHIELSKHRMDRETAIYNKLDSSYPISRKVFEKDIIIRI